MLALALLLCGMSVDEAAKTSVAEVADPSVWGASIREDEADSHPSDIVFEKSVAQFVVLRPRDIRPRSFVQQCGPGGCSGGSCDLSFVPSWQPAAITDIRTVEIVKKATVVGLPRVVAIRRATGRIIYDGPAPSSEQGATLMLVGWR